MFIIYYELNLQFLIYRKVTTKSRGVKNFYMREGRLGLVGKGDPRMNLLRSIQSPSYINVKLKFYFVGNTDE